MNLVIGKSNGSIRVTRNTRHKPNNYLFKFSHESTCIISFLKRGNKVLRVTDVENGENKQNQYMPVSGISQKKKL